MTLKTWSQGLALVGTSMAVVALTSATPLAQSTPAKPPTQTVPATEPVPIPFEIKPEKAIIRNDQDFSVRITLRNTSKNDQQLSITSCSSAHPSLWSSDNPDVHIKQVSCLRKETFVLRLTPNETYEQTLLVRVSIPAASIPGKPLKETFRPGFFPWGIPMQNVDTWSNATTVVVLSARQ
jgi:hypothetical protein